MKATKAAVLVLAAAGMTGCATAHSPVNGLFYTDVKSSVMATDAYGGSAKGEACASSILGIVATGDASVDTAKKNGGIAQVIAIDSYSTSLLGITAKYCTVVYGKRGGGKAKGAAAPAAAPAPAAGGSPEEQL